MATRVTIKVDLERRIRAGDTTTLDEIVKLLDEQTQRVAAPKPTTGLGYKELVALLRLELGGDLLVPPKPSAAYIVRIINKLKDYGLEQEDITRLAHGVRRRGYRPPYRLEWLVQTALSHIQAGQLEGMDGMGLGKGVYTGRGNQDGTDEPDEGGKDEV